MQVFAALADSTRRRIVELLAASDLEAGAIAAEFRVSRPAISRHLRVLREAGVVESVTSGKRRIYSLRPMALTEVAQWVDRYTGFWRERLEILEQQLTQFEPK